ncbi:MAG TPA: alpha/beta hydrolase [Steroidobacteraceae bacterium]|jgi:pimeloyl-ACP methyl ester carboxylesterase
MSYQPRRIPRHEFLMLRGVKHRLTWWGEASESPVILLHGFMDCGDTWQFLVDCLPVDWSLVAPDWRGFGGSEWPAGGYWFPDYLADLEGLLDLLTPGASARVIGHSMGANVAALYCGVRPQRLRWLVNLEGLGLPRTQPDMAPERYARWLDELGQPARASRYRCVEQLATVLQQRNPRLTADRALFVARSWSRPLEGGAAGEVALAFDPRHRCVNPVLYRREEAEACWARVTAPMLLIGGAESGHRQRRVEELTDERFARLFHDLRTVTLPGVGHMMHHEDPQAVARAIVEFERAHA